MLSQISSHQNLINSIILIVGSAISLVLFYTAYISIMEKEYRAARVAIILAVILFLPFLAIYLYDFQYKELLSVVILIVIPLKGLILFLPLRPKVKEVFQKTNRKFDERDTMFSRNELIPGTEKFDKYYIGKTEVKNLDNKFRQKPGLLSAESKMFDHLSFASAHANLEIIEALKPNVNGVVNEKKVEIDVFKITNYIKKWSKSLGVHSVGVTEVKDYHLYSHKGRGDLYGKEIKNKHKYAIALTIEMNNDMVLTAPKGPIVMESTQQYLNSGTIALQIAFFIRKLGYEARAHIDGNYELICPLVARDAGLGEIGRMGLLMTPKLGPRVRIAVVTTDIPLEISKEKDFSSAIDFCSICKKCAEVCPSQSISFNNREIIDNELRWKINSESCFTYWTTAGTDCGRCMAVCPYSHPNNALHNFIRWGIKNSYIFRRFALYMDDLFYGRKPKSRKLPSWIEM